MAPRDGQPISKVGRHRLMRGAGEEGHGRRDLNIEGISQTQFAAGIELPGL
jgi:hypothetical protein